MENVPLRGLTTIHVHSVGNGCIKLHSHKEEYIVTFPTAFARSILTIPWVELGGQAAVECPSSGYEAKINFLTKVA